MSAETPLPPWQPASNSAWGDQWFLCRDNPAGGKIPFRDRYHFDRSKSLVWYASYGSAVRAARRMNAEEAGMAFVRTLLAQSQPQFSAALEAVTAELTATPGKTGAPQS